MNRTSNRLPINYLGRFFLPFAVAVAVCQPWEATFAQVQRVGGPSPSAETPQSVAGGAPGAERDSGPGGAIVGGIANGIPDLFRRRMLFQFSLGQSYNMGISDESLTNNADFQTTASASLSYNWQRKRSDYIFDYTGSYYRSVRLRGLGSPVNHNFRVMQTVQLGPRTLWSFSHQFTLTPQFGDELLTDSVLQQVSFVNPLPRFGTVGRLTNPYNLPTTMGSIPSVNPLPDLGSPVGVFVGAPQGTVPFYSRRTSHTSRAELSHALSDRTNLSFGGNYDRLRFKDDDYFQIDQIGVSASVGRMITERASLGFSYYGSRLEQPGGFDLTWTQGGRISLSYQLTPGIQLSIGYGPTWVRSSGQEAIPLSPVLANLLGRPILFRNASASLFTWAWNGGTSFSKRWERTHFGIGYGRGVSAMNALSSVSKSDSLSLTLGRQIGRGTSLSGSATYMRNDFISLQDIGRFDQASAAINLSRPLTSGMDFSVFASYSRLLTSTQLITYNGYASFGVQFVFHFPRVSVQ